MPTPPRFARPAFTLAALTAAVLTDRQPYRLGVVWLLAQPYGYPSVMSSYAFDRATQAGGQP